MHCTSASASTLRATIATAQCIVSADGGDLSERSCTPRERCAGEKGAELGALQRNNFIWQLLYLAYNPNSASTSVRSVAMASRCDFLLVLVAALLSLAHSDIPGDLIQSLPGWQGALPTKQYSGYINVNTTTGKYLHYW